MLHADARSTNLLKSLMLDGEKLYVLAITYGLAQPSMSHLVLDAEKVAPFSDLSHVPSGLGTADNGFLVKPASGKDQGLRAIWTEASRIRTVSLLPNGEIGQINERLPGGDGRRYERIVDVGLREHGYVLAVLLSEAVVVVRVGDEAENVAEFENAKWTYEGAPVYDGNKVDGGVQFTRMYYDVKSGQTKVQTITITDNGAVTQTEESVAFDTANGVPRSVAAKEEDFFVSTVSGALLLTTPGETKWKREESLANLAGVHFVDLGEPETEEALHSLLDESFIHRVVRHVTELRLLPSYIVHFVQRLKSTTVAEPTAALTLDRLHRDQFGLQKLIVAVTKGGKVFGLDSANGHIVWSRNLGFFSPQGPELDVYQTFATRNISDAGNPQIAVIAVRRRKDETMTMGYHVDAFTGEPAGKVHETFGVPEGKELFEEPPKKAFLTPYVNCCTKNLVVAVQDEEDRLHIYPSCKKVLAAMEKNEPPMFFSELDEEIEGTSLRGYTLGKRGVHSDVGVTRLWSRPFPAQEVLEVQSLTPSTTASYGRALGDKSVLYKYLNPHLSVVTTLSPLKAVGHIFVIDTATGAAVYLVDVPHVVGKHIHTAMVENWLVYAWLEAPDSATVGGWRLGSVELYEAQGDESSAGRSSFATVPKIDAISQTFILNSDVKAMTFTTSTFGVTTKDLVYVNDAGQVATLPRRILDPRRPLGKPSKADQEEMLVPYSPVIQDVPSAVLSHKYPVAGVDHLTTSPALLESTSLLLGSGLDLFCTRSIQPSGSFDVLSDGFAKFQLVITLVTLVAGVAVAGPAVTRKTLRSKWFS